MNVRAESLMAGTTIAIRTAPEPRCEGLLVGVLEVINKARRALAMRPIRELPRGVPAKSRLCVLARALRMEILLDEEDAPFALLAQYRKARKLANAWRVTAPREAWNGWAVDLPAELRGFVHEFDARRHPELIMRDVRAQLLEAGVEMRALRLRRRELRSLRMLAIRTQARTSVLIAQGRDLCRRSMNACADARMLAGAGKLDTSEIVRRRHEMASSRYYDARESLMTRHPSLMASQILFTGVTRPPGLSAGMSAAQLGL
jgi:hypothetical protein